MCRPPIENISAGRRYSKVIWRSLKRQKPSAVCFDMDSTLIKEETLDAYSSFFGLNLGGNAITEKAMGGQIGFRKALTLRLEMLRPSKAQYERFLNEFTPTLSDGVEQLITVLRGYGVDLYIVTGGFVEVAKRVAQRLNIPNKNVFANRILFSADGCYEGFDKSQLTSQSGVAPIGKAGVCQLLKERHSYKLLVMVGDGGTDMEARPPADLFVGYGGNQVREKVRLGSDWFVRDFRTLTDAIEEK
ncbi:hypothetical protein niasHT_021612 [Heterodera trifolii]|uniref:Phosphoserine phosphatase n=1 Tax=Heterodera trifolii TaxID=157864 RepID=A0ABD2JBH7_9BILA